MVGVAEADAEADPVQTGGGSAAILTDPALKSDD
jgi:hypothetical protein